MAPGDFESRIKERPPGLLRELWRLLMSNKKWWLVPLLIVFLLVGLLVVLGGSGAAPFIYTLF